MRNDEKTWRCMGVRESARESEGERESHLMANGQYEGDKENSCHFSRTLPLATFAHSLPRALSLSLSLYLKIQAAHLDDT